MYKLKFCITKTLACRQALFTAFLILSEIGNADTRPPPRPVHIINLQGLKVNRQLQVADTGEITKLIKTAFEAIGMKPVMILLPRQRAYIEAKKGTSLASFPWAKTIGREKDFYFSDVLYSSRIRIVVHAASPLHTFTYQDALHKKSCDLVGSVLFSSFFDTSKVSVTYVNSPAQCLKMLTDKRIDFFISPNWVEPGELGKNARFIADSLQLDLNQHLIISKSIPDGEAIIKDFNRALKKLKAL